MANKEGLCFALKLIGTFKRLFKDLSYLLIISAAKRERERDPQAESWKLRTIFLHQNCDNELAIYECLKKSLKY
jgi:hypothetical protein